VAADQFDDAQSRIMGLHHLPRPEPHHRRADGPLGLEWVAVTAED
jgi:hypothetical protein